LARRITGLKAGVNGSAIDRSLTFILSLLEREKAE
jgi:hypothetical protein